MNPEQNNLNQTITGAQPQVVPVAQPMPGAQPQVVPVAQPMPGAQPQVVPVAQPMPGAQPQVVPVAQPMPGAQPQAVPVAQPMPGAQPQIVPIVDPNQQQFPQLPTTPSLLEDDELVKAYVGPKYDTIVNSKFNIGAFFFTPLYLYYRKLFLYGILVFIVDLLIINFTKFSILTTVISVLVAMLFSKLYIPEVKKRVEKIKQKNPDKSIEEIKEICAKKGGTSIGLAALGCFINGLLVTIVLILLLVLGFATVFSELINLEADENKEISENENTNTEFNGVFMFDTSINMADKFIITVPAEYTDNSDTYTYEYSYSAGTGVFDECEISLKVVDGYASGETLIKQMQVYHSKNTSDITPVNQVTKNGITWNSYNTTDTFGKTHYYGTTKDNKAYLLTFEFDQDVNTICEPHIDQVLNTIQTK